MKFGIFQLNIHTVGWILAQLGAIWARFGKKLLFLQNSEENSVEKIRNRILVGIGVGA